MAKQILTTQKPWVLLVFVMMVLSTIVALTSAFGIAGNPLSEYIASPTNLLVPGATGVSATGGLDMLALLLLALDVIILYGLSQGHVWSWYLLFFVTAASIVVSLLGVVAGSAINFIPLLVNVVMLAALVKKEVINVYKPDLKILPAEGVW